MPHFHLIFSVLLIVFGICNFPKDLRMKILSKSKKFVKKGGVLVFAFPVQWSNVITKRIESMYVYSKDARELQNFSPVDKVITEFGDILLLLIQIPATIVSKNLNSINIIFSLKRNGQVLLPKALFVSGMLAYLLRDTVIKSDWKILIILDNTLSVFVIMYFMFHYILALFHILESQSKFVLVFFSIFPLLGFLILTVVPKFFEKSVRPNVALLLLFAMVGPVLMAIAVWSIQSLEIEDSGKIGWGGIKYMLAPIIFMIGLYVLVAGIGTALYVEVHPNVQTVDAGRVSKETNADFQEVLETIVHFKDYSNDLVQDLESLIASANNGFLYGAQCLNSMSYPAKTDPTLIQSKKIEINYIFTEGYLAVASYTGIAVVFVTNGFSNFKPDRTSVEILLDDTKKQKTKSKA